MDFAHLSQEMDLVFDNTHFTADSFIQKRSLSYATTIYELFELILQSKQPADRVLANYFREHKKHGSKDRRIIRETLFALFRWWGWLWQLNKHDANNSSTTWLVLLATAAFLENHQWRDIRNAWALFANIPVNIEPNDNLNPLERAQIIIDNLCSDITITWTQLAPNWFWPLVPHSQHQQLAQALSERPPIWARVQNITTDQAIIELKQQNIDATKSGIFNDAINLGTHSINLNNLPLFQNGYLEIQDLASQVIGQICHPNDDELWWDACAGAGGKSLQLSSLAKQKQLSNCQIISSDIRPKALEQLKKRYQRAKFTNIHIKPWHANHLPVEPASCDGVLVDAPCSCTGTWRRNPDMRWLDSAQQVMAMPNKQLDILCRSALAVKQGGSLIYATCSLLDIENQQLVNQFLELYPEFELQTIIHPFTGQSLKMLTIWPYEANTDGMFVVKMKKIK